MSVNDTGATGISLSALAQMLISGDNDGKITKSELELFVKEHQIEFLSINSGNKKTVEEMMAELKAELKNSYVGDDTTAENKDAENSDTEKTDNTPSINNEEYAKLQKEVEELEKNIADYKGKKTELEKQKKDKEAEIIAKKEEFDKLEKEIATENEEYKKIIDKINQTAKETEEEIAYQQKRTVYAALAAYNPEEDGEWDAYIEKRLNNENFTAAFKSAVKGLTSKSDFIALNLQALGARFSKIGGELEALNNDYKNITGEIANTNSLIETSEVSLSSAKETLSKSVSNLVSEAEMALV